MNGLIKVVTGPMFSSKTLKLVQEIERQSYFAGGSDSFVLFKPTTDTRDIRVTSRGHIAAYDAFAIDPENPSDMFSYIGSQTTVGIDEAQFFSKGIVGVVRELKKNGYRVLISALDMDYRGEPFGPVPSLLAVANYVDKCTGICMKCKAVPGEYTQLLYDGKPVSYDFFESNILPDDDAFRKHAKYEVRCGDCHEVPGRPW